MSEDERRKMREWLRRWTRVTECCASKHEDIKRYKALIESVSDIHPQQLTGMPHSGTISDPTQIAALESIRLKERYEGRIRKLAEDITRELALADAVDEAVETLSAAEASVIDHRYKQRKQYDSIAKVMGYSEDNAKKIERAAIEKLYILVLEKLS